MIAWPTSSTRARFTDWPTRRFCRSLDRSASEFVVWRLINGESHLPERSLATYICQLSGGDPPVGNAQVRTYLLVTHQGRRLALQNLGPEERRRNCPPDE